LYVVLQPHFCRGQYGARGALRDSGHHTHGHGTVSVRVVHAEHQIDHDRDEAVQPHTIAIITGFLSGVVNKAIRSFCTI
jgi:hypothetical protein